MTADYEVGYKRPPSQHRWKKGQSGNPAGKPKGRHTLGAVLASALNETVTIKSGGEMHQTTLLDVVTRALIDRAKNGDARLMGQLLKEIHLHEAAEEKAAPQTPALNAADEDVLKALYARLTRDAMESLREQKQEKDSPQRHGGHGDTRG